MLHTIEGSYQRQGGLQAHPAEACGPIDAGPQELSLACLPDEASPAARLVNATLQDALRAGASDVHLEATPGGLAVRLRIDGVLDTAAHIEGQALAEQAIARLKELATLNTAERRVPQDGRFRASAQGHDLHLRLSILPGVHGEDAVVRILGKQAVTAPHGRLGLDTLGFEAPLVEGLHDLLQLPCGMLLVTGPTGSGKTTTLYAALAQAATGRGKIVTIEDPVACPLPGVLQVGVDETKGVTFAHGLRSILRHDPDLIMVGDIRDPETAEIAVQSALTGHPVLSTVQANSVFDVFSRLAHMGLDPHALACALNGIWAQRLVRLICPHCSEPAEPGTRELARLGLTRRDVSAYDLRQGRGCGECRGTGYQGRRPVAELLRLDDELRELVAGRESPRRLRDAARRKGARSLTESALGVARQGHTTLQEICRVTLTT